MPVGVIELLGAFCQGSFELRGRADAVLDLSRYQKGYGWVNGHNLGRYWNLGPHQRLYCPAPWLRHGTNAITVLDWHETTPAPLAGKETLTD